MPDFNIILPSKPIVVSEDEFTGVYEIEGLYPGYGHTLGNSLRRIILSSLPGFAITSVKIDGVPHEFSTIKGVKEDVITILLNLKRVRFKVVGDGDQIATLKASGEGVVTAGKIKTSGEVEIVNQDQIIATLTEKAANLDIEIVIEKGIGYVAKEILQKDKVDIGIIPIDAIFTPIRRVNYEVEQMRVGNRTDYNRLRITLETDGIVSPREALEQSIAIMINQLKAVVGFREDDVPERLTGENDGDNLENGDGEQAPDEQKTDALKTRIDDLELSARTMKSLVAASIRTVGGLARKKESDLLEIPGLGEKGVQEIKRALSNFGIVLKD
ncbi:MAG: DNA-directed RNA polymerase subunit alpha [Candidatus Vogelbacteria bacterium CG10_big_fil_rev_8_21_14_0_10_50_13]|uniref:DNA-directed RNA polymerase subunit alpha n=1 Tax=Candidatus Vogelbacteria bacterium CG10_big_fil_rev_8_21_14_0_10_50_13 TaxID=1975044 RepID=A0A2H0RG38_9BACT|nr:MAG: DNA-directed RNA polymerase subunit alpha [Candidatus Vogelbacteria bacterium CG10_big_fil_rev_8_21_14_0_10_50_13]